MSQLQMRIASWGEVALDDREVRRLMRSAGNEIRSKTRRLLQRSQGGGRIYAGGGGAAYRGAYRAGAYRASGVGEAPVSVSGSLRESLRVYVRPEGRGFVVRALQYYGLFLEAGARGGGNYRGRRGRGRSRQGSQGVRVLEPRPFLSRVMQEEGPRLEHRIGTAFHQALTWRETKTQG